MRGFSSKSLGSRNSSKLELKTGPRSEHTPTVSPITLTFWGSIFVGVVIFVLNGLFFPPDRTVALAPPAIITSPMEIPLSVGESGEPISAPTTLVILPSRPVVETVPAPVTTTTTVPPAALIAEEPKQSRSIMVTGSCPINKVCEERPPETTIPNPTQDESPVVSFVEEVVEILTNPQNPRDDPPEEITEEQSSIPKTELIAELTSRISIWNNQLNMPLGIQNLILNSKASNKQITQFHISSDGHLTLDTPEETCYNRIEQAKIDINLRDGLRPILYEGDSESAIAVCQEAQFDLKKIEL